MSHKPSQTTDELQRLGSEVLALSRSLKGRYAESKVLHQIMERVSGGQLPEEVMDYLFATLRPIIPYDRIALVILENLTDGDDQAQLAWLRGLDDPTAQQPRWPVDLACCRLDALLAQGLPLVITNLSDHLACSCDRAQETTLFGEGMQSALVCPLQVAEHPLGLLIFCRREAGAYQEHHRHLLGEIAGQLANALEKGRTHRRLKQLNELKNRLLAVAAHDLRNPIGVVHGYLDLLAMEMTGPLNERQRKYVEQMKAATDGMFALLNDLLDYSVLEAGRMELRKERVQPRAFLIGFVEKQQLNARRKSQTLRLVLAEALPPVEIDPRRIEQVLTNLIDNAIKFSPAGGAIDLTAGALGRWLEIAVSDQGPGIPEQELPRLFQEFFRTSVQPSGGEKSTGLGLAIVKRLVEAHRGEVRVTSQVGVGSRFAILLPAAPPLSKADDAEKNAETSI